MTVTINGTTGVSLCDTNSVPTSALQASAVTQPKVGSGVAGNGPAFSAYQSSAQTLSTNTWTKLQFQTKEFDTNSNYDNTTNYRFTPTVAGYYQITGGYSVSTTATSLNLNVYKNGSSSKILYAGSASSAGAYGSALIYMNGSTDYVELYAYIGSGQALASGVVNTYFSGCLVRAA